MGEGNTKQIMWTMEILKGDYVMAVSQNVKKKEHKRA